MSVVAAVKEAVEAGLGDFWMMSLPESQRRAYFKGTAELRREDKDEWDDYVTMVFNQLRLEIGGFVRDFRRRCCVGMSDYADIAIGTRESLTKSAAAWWEHALYQTFSKPGRDCGVLCWVQAMCKQSGSNPDGATS